MPRTLKLKKQVISKDSSRSYYKRANLLKGPTVSRKRRFSFSGFGNRIINIFARMSNFQFVMLLVVLLGLTYAGVTTLVQSTAKSGGLLGTIVDKVGSIACTDELNPDCWSITNGIFPKLEQSDGFTNALLIGLDTRGKTGLKNTDTIMVASYNHRDGKTLLISFPRDLYVPHYIDGKGPYYHRINAVYARGDSNKNTTGLETLQTNIEDYLDIDIHYTATVRLETVIEVVDAVGGVEIKVDKYYEDIYPKSELSAEKQATCKLILKGGEYCLYKYEKGIHKLSGEEALIYARMRQFSSDFDRARRQQEVISALKDKVLADERSMVEQGRFLYSLYETIQNDTNVKSNLKYKDIVAALFLMQKADKHPVSIVLDPSFGGAGKLIYATSLEISEEQRMYVVKPKDESFKEIRAEINNIRKSPGIYREGARVLVLNRSGQGSSNFEEIDYIKSEDPYFKSFTVLTKGNYEDSQEVQIFTFGDPKPETVNYLKDIFNTEHTYNNPEEFDIEQSRNKEDVLVILNAKPEVLDNPEDTEDKESN